MKPAISSMWEVLNPFKQELPLETVPFVKERMEALQWKSLHYGIYKRQKGIMVIVQEVCIEAVFVSGVKQIETKNFVGHMSVFRDSDFPVLEFYRCLFWLSKPARTALFNF